MTIWIAVILAGIGTYAARISMLFILGSRRVPVRVEKSLAAIAPAIIGVIVAGAFFADRSASDIRPEHIAAAAVAFITVRKTKKTTHGALAGMTVIWIAALGGLT